jgi:hypothetical protein
MDLHALQGVMGGLRDWLKTRFASRFSTAEVGSPSLRGGNGSLVFKIDGEPFATELFIELTPTGGTLTKPPVPFCTLRVEGETRRFDLDDQGKPWEGSGHRPLAPPSLLPDEISDAIWKARKKQ